MTAASNVRTAAEAGVGSCHRSLAVGEAKISEQQLVEPSPEVSGLARVGGFFVVSKVNLSKLLRRARPSA